MQIDKLRRLATLTILYVGPAQSGKTSSLRILHEGIPSQHRTELRCMDVQERTVAFDYTSIPHLSIQELGVHLNIKLFTAPGQFWLRTYREQLLREADGLIFVADSQEAQWAANVETAHQLSEDLVRLRGKSLLPLVVQVNKTDLAVPQVDLARLATLFQAVLSLPISNDTVLPTVAKSIEYQRNIWEAFRMLLNQLLNDLRNNSQIWE